MPFQSEKQRRYLWANEPEIARDWTDTYGSGIAKALGGRIGFANGRDVWNQYQLTSHGPFGGPLGYLGFKPQAFEDQDFSMDNLIMGGEYVPGADLNKAYRLRMNEELKRNKPISYNEWDIIPSDNPFADMVGTTPYKGEGYSIGDVKNIGLNQGETSDDPFKDYIYEGPRSYSDWTDEQGFGSSGSAATLYKTPRTIADQNKVLGRTFTEDQGGIVDWLMNQGSNLRSNISQAYNVGKEKYVMPTLGVMGAVANYLNPLNPQSRNYNPELQGQVDALNARNMLGNQSSPYKITSGPLAGKNLISGFGTNDYDEMLAKKISWFEKRKAEKKSISDKAYQKTIQEQQRREAEKRQAATAAAAAAQVRSNIQRYGTGDRPNTGMNRPGGGRGQSPTGGDVQGTPFNTGGLAALWPR